MNANTARLHRPTLRFAHARLEAAFDEDQARLSLRPMEEPVA